MQAELIEVMHQQVRAIHRAVTGDDLPETESAPSEEAPEPHESEADITRRFAELGAIARAMPSVGARIPPFAFKPPVDVIACDDAVVLELAVCGIRREDLRVERHDNALVISGVRRDGHAAQGRVFHAEIPRGPFLRVIPLPFTVDREPRIEFENGLLRIYVTTEAEGGTGGRMDSGTNQGSEENSK